MGMKGDNEHLKVIELHVFDKADAEKFFKGYQVFFKLELEAKADSKKDGEKKLLEYLKVFGLKQEQMAVLEIFEPRAVQNFRIWKRYAVLSKSGKLEIHRFEDESDVCPPDFFKD